MAVNKGPGHYSGGRKHPRLSSLAGNTARADERLATADRNAGFSGPRPGPGYHKPGSHNPRKVGRG